MRWACWRVLLAAIVGARIALPVPVHADEIQRAILSLSVNQVPKGEVIVLLRPSDVLIREGDLERAGLHGLTGLRETVQGETYVSLASLAPGVVAALDEAALALRLTARPELLAPSIVELRAGRPPGIVYRKDASAFLNYAVTLRDVERYAIFTQLGLSLDGLLLFSDVARTEDGDIVRGLSNVTYDDRPRLTRWILGDHLALSDRLGGRLLVGGLSISREFAIDPYLFRYPTIQFAGVVSTPATAELYVNGLRLRQVELPPGTFELRNLPVPAGSGEARLVVQDAFGIEQVIVSPYYLSTALLARGLHDYRYSLGFRRDDLGTESWDYHRPGFMGRHRVGLTDTVTAGARLEGASDLVSGGFALTGGLPLGELDLAFAASQERGHSGVAGSLAYRYVGRWGNVGALVSSLSDRYANLGLGADDDRARLEMSAFAGTRLGRLADLTVQYARADFRDSGARERVSGLLSIRLTSRVSAVLSVSRASDAEGQHTVEGFGLLSMYLGDRTTASVSVGRRESRTTASVDVQRSLPLGPGLGYRFQTAVEGDTVLGAGTVEYQGSYGRYAAAYQNVDGMEVSLFSIAGGVVAMGGTLFATRPVTESFALIQVPGVEGVRGYLNNQEIGRTDARGDLPVPNLLAYYGNRLGIADVDIPLEFAVEATERTIATPFRGAAVVAFPVQRIRAVTGRLLIDGPAPLIPAFGQLTVTVEGRHVDSPIGRDGEFYLDSVPPGRHQALIEHDRSQCRFVLEVPPADAAILDLGALRCVLGATP